ncbi:class I SAM-dependent methyltransferase [Pseudonocardia endophytica]|uniref:Methyltransferase family protein n=1 Tax=Pseudonocardia endophytica TaxID=401976 RepID=A0A4R1HTP9_PSEEN|nr:class I SAM-dependent methyltransferase [Pseudonocardia endophytica]TCK20802.1 methyltransferase family protein [Pseudonocardia endophytica]
MDLTESLPLTGERTVPGIAHENYWFRRHEVVYAAIAPDCSGGVVLEAGCGEGYGADLLAGTARRVLALDYDVPTVAHVASRYPRVAVSQANLVALPVADGSIDALVSLQVIEHLWEQERFLAECRRVLRPGGRLLVSTPNRLTFSPGRDTPLNPFHTRELSPAELHEMVVAAGFDDVTVQGLFHGPRLRELDAAHGGSIVEAQTAVVLSGSQWPPELLADVAAVRASDFVLLSTGLGESLDLLVTARRP